jgi:two-component system, response regulator YesN
MEQAQRLGIDLLAPWYQVLVVRMAAQAGAPASASLSHARDPIVAAVGGESPALLAFKSAPGQWVLILKGDAPAALTHEAERLAALLRRLELDGTSTISGVGVGPATERLGTIAQSYTQALSESSAGRRATLAEVAAPHDAQPPDQRHSAMLVAKARSYIDAQYADPEISLHQVAAQVLLSPTYFSVLFAREMGQTFIEYLTNVRIRKAIELLRTSALTASEIGYKVGYQNPRYFYVVFRKVVGQAPTEFRRQA